MPFPWPRFASPPYPPSNERNSQPLKTTRPQPSALSRQHTCTLNQGRIKIPITQVPPNLVPPDSEQSTPKKHTQNLLEERAEMLLRGGMARGPVKGAHRLK